jgi:ribosomal protein S18 acetylase RimI-like enzyme
VRPRRVPSSDWRRFRTARLRALEESPAAFASSYEQEVGWDAEAWQTWIDAGAAYLAENECGNAVGVVVGHPDRADRGVAHLVSMWVDPSVRGTGVAEALVEQVLAWASGTGASVLALYVAKDNPRARRLYERLGFRATGIEIRRSRDLKQEERLERRLEPSTRGAGHES